MKCFISTHSSLETQKFAVMMLLYSCEQDGVLTLLATSSSLAPLHQQFVQLTITKDPDTPIDPSSFYHRSALTQFTVKLFLHTLFSSLLASEETAS